MADPLGKTVDCAWDPTDPGSWEINREQNGVQAFYLANAFHDHLAEPGHRLQRGRRQLRR